MIKVKTRALTPEEFYEMHRWFIDHKNNGSPIKHEHKVVKGHTSEAIRLEIAFEDPEYAVIFKLRWGI